MKRINNLTMCLLIAGACMFLQNCKKDVVEQAQLVTKNVKSDIDPEIIGVEVPGESGGGGGGWTPPPYGPSYGSLPSGSFQVSQFRNFPAGTTIAVNGIYHLEFQTDGNLVLYKGQSEVLWAADTYVPGGVLTFDQNGAVRINKDGDEKWRGTKIHHVVYDQLWWYLQSDGNFVGYEGYVPTVNGRIPAGAVLGATYTDGGRRSDNYGRLD